MFNILRARVNQGSQYIPDVRSARVGEKFRGLPVIDEEKLKEAGPACRDICPTQAISLDPLRLDLGRCLFCGDCARACPEAIRFTNFHKIASSEREYLVIGKDKTPGNYQAAAILAKRSIRKIFGRSLKLRQVSAGGCNACEMELNASSNVNFDIGRFGVDFVASPRHADGLVITGPVTENMAQALEDATQATPDPKLIVAVGTCAISGGLFASSPAIKREYFQQHPIDLYVPGCPIHPLTFVNGILDLLGRK